MFTTLTETSVHETPNAVMRRYPGASTALWRTEAAPGSSGPEHVIDIEQVVVVVEGRLEATVDGLCRTLEAGDAVVLPAGATRRLANPFAAPLVTLTAARPGSVAQVGDGHVPLPWGA